MAYCKHECISADLMSPMSKLLDERHEGDGHRLREERSEEKNTSCVGAKNKKSQKKNGFLQNHRYFAEYNLSKNKNISTLTDKYFQKKLDEHHSVHRIQHCLLICLV